MGKRERVTGKKLNEQLGLDLKHALYREDGKWYHHLTGFPGVLFDSKGFVIFYSRQEYEDNPYLQHHQDLHVRMGISTMPNYITYNQFKSPPAISRDIMQGPEGVIGHTHDFFDEIDDGVAEGAVSTRIHKERERKPALIKLKKQIVLSRSGKLACEICNFDFLSSYGELGKGFAECHHIKPVSELKEGDLTRLVDLAIVCANCHRMLHRKPMITMTELRRIVDCSGKESAMVKT